MNTLTSSDAVSLALDEKPYFRVVKSIPEDMTPQIEDAVNEFIKRSHMPDGVDNQGFYHQTLEAIATASYLGGNGEFWIGTKNGKLLIYVLGYVGKDIDNRLSYHVSQAWVRKEYCGRPVVKEWWEAIRKRAKTLLCGHLVITSTRNPKAYERFLGHGMKEYAVIMKETF
jgi:hypothetical protein